MLWSGELLGRNLRLGVRRTLNAAIAELEFGATRGAQCFVEQASSLLMG